MPKYLNLERAKMNLSKQKVLNRQNRQRNKNKMPFPKTTDKQGKTDKTLAG